MCVHVFTLQLRLGGTRSNDNLIAKNQQYLMPGLQQRQYKISLQHLVQNKRKCLKNDKTSQKDIGTSLKGFPLAKSRKH